MRKLLVANWKMNPQRQTEAVHLTEKIDKKNVVICPPFPFVHAVKKIVKQANLGSQDVFWEEKGAYTGEVSPRMLKNLGVEYVVVGHSERRRWLYETDEVIHKKVLAALRVGLRVVLCVGEPIEVRRKGCAATQHFVRRQLEKDLRGISRKKPEARQLVVAYEPVWAIGTGRPDTPRDTVEMAKFIKRLLAARYRLPNVKVLYGGSVTSKNAANFIRYKEIDGALVGGASLNAQEFNAIIRVCSMKD